MRKAEIYVDRTQAGILEEIHSKHYVFTYLPHYQGLPISLTMPVRHNTPYIFDQFPPFFEGLLPEGIQLETLLRSCKLDKYDYFGQLIQVGSDLVGAVTVKEVL
jgi:serine/threonine-protein kinase HipA